MECTCTLSNSFSGTLSLDCIFSITLLSLSPCSHDSHVTDSALDSETILTFFTTMTNGVPKVLPGAWCTLYIDTGQYEILGIYIHTLWKWAIGRKASSSSNSTSSLRTSCYTTHHPMLCYELCTYGSIHFITLHMTVLWDVLCKQIQTEREGERPVVAFTSIL